MNAVMQRAASIVLACCTFQISETCYRYSPVLSDESEEVADWLERLEVNKRSWSFELFFLYLCNVQGYGWFIVIFTNATRASYVLISISKAH